MVVTAGKGWVTSRLKDTGSPSQMTHMGIGSGSTAAAAGNTTLVTQLDRQGLTVIGGTVSGSSIEYSCTFEAGEGTGAVIEAGIFNANNGGTMLARTVFDAGVVNKGSADKMTITWTVSIS